MAPGYYYTNNVDDLLENLIEIINEYNLDGIYFDGEYMNDFLRSFELVKKTRSLLGDKFYTQHLSWNNHLIRRTHRWRIPVLDAYADLIWNGEGVKLVDDDVFRLNYAGRNLSNTPSTLLGELRPVNYGLSREESISLSWTPEQQIDNTFKYKGIFRTSPHTDLSAISDKQFQTSIKFNNSYFEDKYNKFCLDYTCGDNICDIGENIFNCRKDCAPTSTDTMLKKSNDEYSLNKEVSQWILNNRPLYLLHFNFNGKTALDVSGNSFHPYWTIGINYNAPKSREINGRKAFYFNNNFLYSRDYYNLILKENFSSFAVIKPENLKDKQIIFSLGSNFYYGIENSKFKVYAKNASKVEGEEEIVGGYTGKGVRARPNDASWQAIRTLNPLTLSPGTYDFSARFKTTLSKTSNFILYTGDWNKTCNPNSQNKAFYSPRVHGNNNWQEVSFQIDIPETDDCGTPIQNLNWYVYLYTYQDNNDWIYYDDIKLIKQGTSENLIQNPGFENDFKEWYNSSYLALEEYESISDIDNNWHTLGIVYEKPKLKLYFDGIKENEVEINLKDFKPPLKYYIGARTISKDTFKGYIDDLILLNSSLGDEEIKEYNNSKLSEINYNGNAVAVFSQNGDSLIAGFCNSNNLCEEEIGEACFNCEDCGACPVSPAPKDSADSSGRGSSNKESFITPSKEDKNDKTTSPPETTSPKESPLPKKKPNKVNKKMIRSLILFYLIIIAIILLIIYIIIQNRYKHH